MVSFGIFGVVLNYLLLRGPAQFGGEFARNVAGDLALQCEQFRKFSSIFFAPDMIAARRIDQFYAQIDLVSTPDDAAHQYGLD